MSQAWADGPENEAEAFRQQELTDSNKRDVRYFHATLREAYRGSLPDVGTLFLTVSGPWVIYEVLFFDLGFSISVVVPWLAVAVTMPDGVVREADLRRCKLKAADAILAALVHFELQPEPVRQHLQQTLGVYLQSMRECARRLQNAWQSRR
ncbi:MAG: hypothetical protein K8J09_00380 [Planctomycetes bacterium]|nr:hypothetical protein [Planctomycetota bacterium]MCC7398260.1 hypothetical protein [Planctomycetota bacterium]